MLEDIKFRIHAFCRIFVASPVFSPIYKRFECIVDLFQSGLFCNMLINMVRYSIPGHFEIVYSSFISLFELPLFHFDQQLEHAIQCCWWFGSIKCSFLYNCVLSIARLRTAKHSKTYGYKQCCRPHFTCRYFKNVTF